MPLKIPYSGQIEQKRQQMMKVPTIGNGVKLRRWRIKERVFRHQENFIKLWNC